jgi:hypothetical protein
VVVALAKAKDRRGRRKKKGVGIMARFVEAAKMQLKMARRSLRLANRAGHASLPTLCGCTTEKEDEEARRTAKVCARWWSPATHLFAELEIGLALLAARVDIVERSCTHITTLRSLA